MAERTTARLSQEGLADQRKSLGIVQQSVGIALGKSESYVSRAEREQRFTEEEATTLRAWYWLAEHRPILLSAVGLSPRLTREATQP